MMHAIIPCLVNMRAPDLIAQLIWPPACMFLIHHTDKTFDFPAKYYRNKGRALLTHIFFRRAHTPKNVERGNPSEAALIL